MNRLYNNIVRAPPVKNTINNNMNLPKTFTQSLKDFLLQEYYTYKEFIEFARNGEIKSKEFSEFKREHQTNTNSQRFNLNA